MKPCSGGYDQIKKKFFSDTVDPDVAALGIHRTSAKIETDHVHNTGSTDIKFSARKERCISSLQL